MSAGEQFYNHIEKSRKTFIIIATINILFFSGISFTYVIPGLKGFSLFFMVLTLFMYFLAANIFVGLFKERIWFVFMLCIILNSLGMGWRLWLEWGEFSLIEHTDLAIYIGYPSVSAIIIIIFYISGNSLFRKKVNPSSKTIVS
ncbi:ABC transporter permease [Sporosarcina koreensis]|uniref:ABC transporter permease n=1 Tax=Sporosarcina koreensis TaxID=334735 RepID=A0ABW0TZJ2_9BACL